MKVYFDTVFFIDYFSSRSIVTRTFRTRNRKGRTTGQLQSDAEDLLIKLKNHDGMTSICSIQEYSELQVKFTTDYLSGAINKKLGSRIVMRYESSKLMTLCKQSNISLIECTEQIIDDTLSKIQYNHLGFIDAIHIRTAELNNADIMVTGDDELIKNTGNFGKLQIVDSDQAVIML